MHLFHFREIYSNIPKWQNKELHFLLIREEQIIPEKQK